MGYQAPMGGPQYNLHTPSIANTGYITSHGGYGGIPQTQGAPGVYG
jgi:hypothetical protein